MVAGNALLQTAVSIVIVCSGSVVTLIVLIVSQPVAALTVSMIVPGIVNTCPSMVAGNALLQTAVSIVIVCSGSVVTLIVLIVSQPVAALTVSMIVPGIVNTCPSMVAGNALLQTAVSIVIVCNGRVVTLIVLIVSQPVAALTVSMIVPGIVNT